MAHHIHLTDSGGHPVVCPLWKLPLLIKQDVEAKQAEQQAVKDREAIRLQAEETAKQQAQAEHQRIADHVANPVDFMNLPDLGE